MTTDAQVRIDAELQSLGHGKIAYCIKQVGEYASMELAIGSRETGMRNIVGGGYFKNDGFGHMIFHTTGVDRGFWQFNIKAHYDFLSTTPGCHSGQWEAADGNHTAAEVGFVPTFGAGLRQARKMHAAALAFAVQHSIAHEDRLRFVIVSHNLGIGGAWEHYKDGGIDGCDAATPHRDYSKDVMAKIKMVERFLADHDFSRS